MQASCLTLDAFFSYQAGNREPTSKLEKYEQTAPIAVDDILQGALRVALPL